MAILEADTAKIVEDRKNAATSLLRWINEGITKAPEDYIRGLDDDLAISYCRRALEKMAVTGHKVPATVLTTLDTNRLNYLHLAVVHDPSDLDGRKNASQNTMRASKFLNLEHKLIDEGAVQYTVTPEDNRIGARSRHDRGMAASNLITLIDEIRSDSGVAGQNVTKEPMMRGIYEALKDVVASGDQICVELASALDNNAGHKHRQSLSPTLKDPAGEHAASFNAQYRAYNRVSKSCQSNGLIHGIAVTPERCPS